MELYFTKQNETLSIFSLTFCSQNIHLSWTLEGVRPPYLSVSALRSIRIAQVYRYENIPYSNSDWQTDHFGFFWMQGFLFKDFKTVMIHMMKYNINTIIF